MDLQDFIAKFAEQFEETDTSEFTADTKYKKLVDWNSMTALSIIAMIDEEYSITIKGEDVRRSSTIEGLFNIVKGYIS